MAAISTSKRRSARWRRWGWWSLGAGVLLGALLACWWFTEPLDTPARGERALATSAATHVSQRPPLPAEAAPRAQSAPPEPKPLAWPKRRLDGDAAKQLLLEVMIAAKDRL